MASSSSNIYPPIQNQETRNWLALPSDVTANILFRVGAVDILENAQKVCTAWYKICKDPAMWRVIRMDTRNANKNKYCRLAVDRSQGQLVDITIVGICNDKLLQYIVDRSSQLKRLEIAFWSGIPCLIWPDASKKVPLLEELSLNSVAIAKDDIESIGRCCPKLKKLKLNHGKLLPWFGRLTSADEKMIAVGENCRELRHLELIGKDITNHGLKAILDGCRHLESLDLRRCMFIHQDGVIWKQCLEQIKCLKLPKDSVEGCPYDISDNNRDKGKAVAYIL